MGLGNTPPGGQETREQMIDRKAAERAAKYSKPTTIKADDPAVLAEFYADKVAHKIANGIPVEKKYDDSLFEEARWIDVETVASILGLGYKSSGAHNHLLWYGSPGKKSSADFSAANKNGLKPKYWFSDIWSGDNIDLVEYVTGIQNKVDAAKKLVGRSVGDSTAWISRKKVTTVPKERKLPVLPEAKASADHEKAVTEGRAYLISRGISIEIIEHHERFGSLRYAPGMVLFLGFDEANNPRSITRRSTRTSWKMDVEDSDKMYACVLPGSAVENEVSDGLTIETVEGGISGLALQTSALRNTGKFPLVIVTGGCTIRNFVESPEIALLLNAATSITLNHENERYSDADLTTKMNEWPGKESDRAAKENRAPLPCPNYFDEAVRKAMTDVKQEKNDHNREIQMDLMQEIAAPGVEVTARHPVNKADSDWADVNVRQLRDDGLI